MNIEQNNKIIKKQHFLLLILFIYTFFYTDIIKEIIIQNIGINVKMSPITVFITLYCILKYGLKYKKNLFFTILFSVIFVLVLISTFSNNFGFSTMLRTFNTILIPLLIVSIKIYEPKQLVTKFVIILNTIVSIYVLIGVIDYFTDGFFLRILNNLLKTSYYNNTIGYDLSIGVFRWFSLFGHPLTNALYMIIFLAINIIYKNVYKKSCGNIYFIYLITLIGTILSNSKFGIIITAMIFVINIINQKNKIVYIVLLFIGVISVVNTSYFENNILARFQNAISSGDITNGRLTVLNSLLNYNLYKLNFFIGKGMSSSDIIVKTIFSYNSGLTNMEIPLFMFMYEYGIYSTISIYIMIFLYPIFKLLIKNKLFISTIIILVFIFINSFNGIATGTGLLQVYTVTLAIVLNIVAENT